MSVPKLKLNILRVGVVLLGVIFLVLLLLVKDGLTVKIKTQDQDLIGEDGLPASLTLGEGEIEKVFDSPVYKARFYFNSIAPQWEENNVGSEDRKVYLRTSSDGDSWTDWAEVDTAGPLRDDDPYPQTMFPEFPLIAEGRYFQYRVTLQRSLTSSVAPSISNLKVTLIDSRTPELLAFIDGIRPLLSTSAGQGPRIVTRAQWRSPDPYGRLFRGTSRYWAPQYVPAKQIFIHHTVTIGRSSDPAAAVRAIWAYHTYTRGWGDIGYNYVIDQKGTIYEGRFGGDNVVGGHVLGYNRGSSGIALLGCFEPGSPACRGAAAPSAAIRASLVTLLSWKSANYEINPNTVKTFCGFNFCPRLWTIAGHRDARPTSCPGSLIYNSLKSIRQQVAVKKPTWRFSAKQLDFSPIAFPEYDVEQDATLHFKNTGTAAWSKNTNRLVLKTTNPNGRTSLFQGSGWIDAQTPAVLNEESVAPGEIGTFTFNLKVLPPVTGKNYETFRLVSEGNTELSQSFTVAVLAPDAARNDELSDIASFQDLGNCETRIRAFISTGASFTSNDWWSSANYCSSSIVKAVSGDFDGDGISDVATLFDNGNGETRIHVFKSDGRQFVYQGDNGWWAGTDLPASAIKHATVGKFNGDSRDDIAVFYDRGGGSTAILVFLSQGNRFARALWWSSGGYSLSAVVAAIAGNFDGRGFDEIAVFYRYSGSETRIHIFKSDGGRFVYQGSGGWWRSTSYASSRIRKVVGGKFDSGGKFGDIAVFYDRGGGSTVIQMFASTGSKFVSKNWWSSSAYGLSAVPFALSGSFDETYDSFYHDLASIYDYPGAETRIHFFRSTGVSFRSATWWKSSDYDIASIKQFVSGRFGR